MPYNAKERKHTLLKDIFENIKNNVSVESSFVCDYKRHITIGNNIHINSNAKQNTRYETLKELLNVCHLSPSGIAFIGDTTSDIMQ